MKTSTIIFLFIACLIATLVKYELGESDQLPQIPLIIKEIQPNYLTNDNFIQANQTFGPRYYYSKFMALGSQLMSIQGWFLFISILCCFLSAYFTTLTARFMFQNDAVGVLAGLFVVALPTPTLAESTFTVYEHLMSPTALVFPLLVAAFYLFFKRQYIILPLLLTGIASLFQVLYGLTTSLLIIFAYLGSGWKFGWHTFKISRLIVGGLILSTFAAANLYPYFTQTVSSSLSTEQFVEIVAHFRNPHHYLPSYFPLQSWILSFFFFGAAGFIFYRIYKQEPEQTIHFQVLLIALGIFGGFVGGYVFVEILPNRLFTTAQTFRYVVLLKWLSVLYFAGWVAHDKWRLMAMIHPISLAVQVFLAKNKKSFLLPVLLLVTVLSLAFIRIEEDIKVLTSILLLAVYILYFYAPFQRKNILIAFAFAASGLIMLPFISRFMMPPEIDRVFAKVYPKYDFAYTYNPTLSELSTFIEENTPENAVFVTPPDLAHLRFSANRAIVVDFKSFPYQDEYMLKWRAAIKDCYGMTTQQGFEAQKALKENYKDIIYGYLLNLNMKYNAEYAVVDSNNGITKNVIFRNEDFKIIQIKPESAE